MHLFDEVAELAKALAPAEVGEIHVKAHRRGVKLWCTTLEAGREHYEAQLIPRRFVDGMDGAAIEIGFHAEHKEPTKNDLAIAPLLESQNVWETSLGGEPEIGVFLGADNWRRASEVWIEPDLDDPELAFELASRVIDYVSATEPFRNPT